MPKVIYINSDQQRTELNVNVGLSVMEGARLNGVAGITAECGGKLACSTCHVYVDEAWLSKLKPVSQIEDELLEGTASERRGNSRLSCQIRMTPDLDGMVVYLPETQS